MVATIAKAEPDMARLAVHYTASRLEFCSFCTRDEREVEVLVHSKRRTAFICRACAVECVGEIDAWKRRKT